MRLTQAEYALLAWAEREAKANLGMHTGGPNEREHRERLVRLRKAMLKIKHGGEVKPSRSLRADRDEVDASHTED